MKSLKGVKGIGLSLSKKFWGVIINISNVAVFMLAVHAMEVDLGQNRASFLLTLDLSLHIKNTIEHKTQLVGIID